MIQIENKNISILLIEDNKADIRLIEELLKKSADYFFDITSCIRLSEGIKTLEKRKYDIVLLDLTLPDSDRDSTLQSIYQFTNITPIIILTGLDDKEIALNSLKSGIQDYIVKGEMTSNLLIRSILYGIERHKIKMEKNKKSQVLTPRLDDKDKEILNILQDHFSISYKEISEKVNLAASTIHSRVQNMRNQGIIKPIDTLVDPFKVGYNALAIVNLAVDPYKLQEISENLSSLDRIQLVATCAGEYNLILKIMASSEKELWRFLNEKVLVLNGIKNQINVSSFIDIYKMTPKIKFEVE